MANIIPFKGTLYNPEKVKDISKVVAPPYDVISPAEQEELYNLDPYNIIRILLGKDFPEDNEKENKYTRSSGFIKNWQDNGILKKDDKPSIYINLQEFEIQGQLKNRLGFIALLKLEDFDTKSSSVYPHENTLIAPKEDREKLIKAIEANLGPIFAIFEDKKDDIGKILKVEMRLPPLIDIFDNHGIRNKLWRISGTKKLEEITRSMKEKKIFIADGHHRYEVGLMFSKFKKDPKYGHILTYFTGLCKDGIVILPVHRLIAGAREEILSSMELDLKKDFIVKLIASKDDARAFLKNARLLESRFVIYKKKDRFIGLVFNGKKSLDVSIVKDLIISPIEKKLTVNNEKISIDFTKDLDYAIKEVDEDRVSFAILLNPTKITQIRDVAFSGERMPQKSTYFYPKVLTGLVMNVF